MIQRIQSLYLLVCVVLLGLFTAYPLAHFVIENNIRIDFYSTGFELVNKESGSIYSPTLTIAVISIISMVYTTICIFFYKRRTLQMRLCKYSILILIGLIVIIFYYMYDFSVNNIIVSKSYTFFLAVPPVNIILHILSYWGIKKDEDLVKSYDRLR